MFVFRSSEVDNELIVGIWQLIPSKPLCHSNTQQEQKNFSCMLLWLLTLEFRPSALHWNATPTFFCMLWKKSRNPLYIKHLHQGELCSKYFINICYCWKVVLIRKSDFITKEYSQILSGKKALKKKLVN